MQKKPIDVPIVDLLVDPRNARLKDEQPSQQATMLALAAQQGSDIVNLAQDMVEQGATDPTMLLGVVPVPGDSSRYLVLEGNRRVVALKGLENPALVLPSLNKRLQKKFRKLSERFADKPIERISCRVFDSEDEAQHWINLRHTGKNAGRGLAEWGADEKDRWLARHGQRSPAGQILDFVAKHGDLSDEAKESRVGILTNIGRLIGTPQVRKRLGIDLHHGSVVSHFPPEEVAKGLSRIAEDLLTTRKKVKDIYHQKDRLDYINTLSGEDLPNESKRLEAPVELTELTAIEAKDEGKKKRKKKPKEGQPQRTTLIPSSFHLEITAPRIRNIFHELKTLRVDSYPNSCSVMLRVFVELSVDQLADSKSILSEEERSNTNLAKRMKKVAEYLQNEGLIDRQLRRAVDRMADSPTLSAGSTITLNQYVHNQYVFPKPSELIVGWDELEPFIEQLWPGE